MQVKCTSCGASQVISTEQKCSFCGSIINPNNLHSENSKVIHTNSKGEKIIIYEKSLQFKSSDGDFLVLLKNISTLNSSILKVHQFKNPILHKIVFVAAAIVFCFIFYQTLIPHINNKSETFDGITYDFKEKSDVSVGAFILLCIILVGPLALLGLFFLGNYNLYIESLKSDDFILLEVNGVSPKKIFIGNKSETEKVYNTIKEKIEFVKMRQE